MAHARVTIALRSSGVNSNAGPSDHAEIRDRFLVPRSKDTRVDFNAKRCRIATGALETESSESAARGVQEQSAYDSEPCGLPGPLLLNSRLYASSPPEERGSCATAIFFSPFFAEHATAN